MHALLGDRDQRLMINARGLPSMIWWTLLAGGVVTVVFTYLFGSPDFDLQLLMTALLSALIGVMFVLIMELNYPYRGDVSVDASGWATLGERFAQRGVAASVWSAYGYHHGTLVCDRVGAATRTSR
jgi:ABC-type branched-subunit amino acid transport system permease subunit